MLVQKRKLEIRSNKKEQQKIGENKFDLLNAGVLTLRPEKWLKVECPEISTKPFG